MAVEPFYCVNGNDPPVTQCIISSLIATLKETERRFLK